MAKLEELTQDSVLKGILPNESVTVIGVRWYGSDTIELTYKDIKVKPHTELILRDKELTLELISVGKPWSFDGNGPPAVLPSRDRPFTENESVSTESSDPQSPSDSDIGSTPTENRSGTTVKKQVLRRFYGSIEIDPLRINRDTPAIANEIIQHLTRLKGASVKIVLEIEAHIPDGVPEDVVRTVTENCQTLKFNNQAFEQE